MKEFLANYIQQMSTNCITVILPIMLIFLVLYITIYFYRKGKYYHDLGYFMRTFANYMNDEIKKSNNIVNFKNKEGTSQ